MPLLRTSCSANGLVSIRSVSPAESPDIIVMYVFSSCQTPSSVPSAYLSLPFVRDWRFAITRKTMLAVGSIHCASLVPLRSPSPNVARVLVMMRPELVCASSILTLQSVRSASGGWAISMYCMSASVLSSQSSNIPNTLTSLIHAQPGATVSRMLYAAKLSLRPPYWAFKSISLYQDGIVQSAAESQLVIGTVEPFV